MVLWDAGPLSFWPAGLLNCSLPGLWSLDFLDSRAASRQDCISETAVSDLVSRPCVPFERQPLFVPLFPHVSCLLFCGFLEGYPFIWDFQQFNYDMSGGGPPSVYSV